MTDIDSRKRAVELWVAEHGLAATEEKIKTEYPESNNERFALLGHARRYAAESQEVEA